MILIGGINDGKRIDISPEKIVMPIYPTLRIDERIPETFEFTTESYKLERLRGKDGFFHVYLEENLDGNDLMRKLIEGYRP
jgi:hypothetical protein